MSKIFMGEMGGGWCAAPAERIALAAAVRKAREAREAKAGAESAAEFERAAKRRASRRRQLAAIKRIVARFMGRK